MDYERWDETYRYNHLNELPWELGRPRPQLVALLESGKVEPGKALDLCCGAGTNTIYIASKGFEVFAMDISEKAVEIATNKAASAGVKIDFQVGNSVYLPFDDEKFNFVFDMGCFHHIHLADREKFIKGIRRVLKKEGTYFMTCFSDHVSSAWNHFNDSQLREIFSPYFEIKEMNHFGSTEGDNILRYFWSVLMIR